MRDTAATLGNADPRDNGFDTVRLLAATAVLISHAFALTGFREPLQGIANRMTLGVVAVGVFFVASGLLIASSAERHSPATFVSQRARRLLPGLAVCVALCLILGSVLTQLPLPEYWRARGTWYFASNAALLSISFSLPGVFTDFPVPGVNGSLWTLPIEALCYSLALAYARLGTGRALLVTAWIVSFVVGRQFNGIFDSLYEYYFGWLAYLFRFFGAGMVSYAFRTQLPLRTDWALAALLVTCLSPLLNLFIEAAATFGAYATVVFAYRAPRWFRAITARGDISYGVYLYAFPIQQLVVPFSMKTSVPWLTNIALALPLTLAAGALSWLLVERRFLRRRIDQTAAAHAF